MGKIKVITDSASDIPKELEEKYGIDIISFTVVLGDREYVSRVDFDNVSFYGMMEEYPDDVPMTSQVTAYHFMEEYYRYYQEGYTDLIMVLINSRGSATYNNSLMAIDLLYEEHPECKDVIRIHSFDSASYCCGYGHTVLEAGKMLQEGADVETICTYIEEALKKRRVYFAIYNLEYAGRSGRIPGAAAFIGDKLGIKPIMKIWDHAISMAAKCRGEKKVAARIAKQVLAEMKDGSDYQIVYGKDPAVGREMADLMTEKLGYGPTEEYVIGPEVAANAGPKVVGVSFDVD